MLVARQDWTVDVAGIAAAAAAVVAVVAAAGGGGGGGGREVDKAEGFFFDTAWRAGTVKTLKVLEFTVDPTALVVTALTILFTSNSTKGGGGLPLLPTLIKKGSSFEVVICHFCIRCGTIPPRTTTL